MKMKNLALAQVRRGERFTLDGVEFVKLEDDLDAAFAVAADTLPECCQFEDDDAEREDHNNYAGSETETAPPTAPTGRFRKCYRISREFAASLPDDLLQVCGYSSWQSWHDAALKRLLGEYAARKRATKKEDKTA